WCRSPRSPFPLLPPFADGELTLRGCRRAGPTQGYGLSARLPSPHWQLHVDFVGLVGRRDGRRVERVIGWRSNHIELFRQGWREYRRVKAGDLRCGVHDPDRALLSQGEQGHWIRPYDQGEDAGTVRPM